MPQSDDTTIEQTITETPEIEELSDEALDRVPGRGEFVGLGWLGWQFGVGGGMPGGGEWIGRPV